MHVVIATIRAKDEASAITLDKMLSSDEGLAKTRAFPGLINIEAHVSSEDSKTLVLTEGWTERAQHSAYMKMRADTGFFDALKPLLAGPLEVVHSGGEVCPAPQKQDGTAVHTVVATITCVNGEARDQFCTMLNDDVEGLAKTRAFPGCLSVECHVSADDDITLVLHATWASRDAHSAYMKMRADTGFFNKAGPLFAKPIDIVHSDKQTARVQTMIGVFKHGIPSYDEWERAYVQASASGLHQKLGITKTTISVVKTSPEIESGPIIQVTHEFPSSKFEEIQAFFKPSSPPFPDLIAQGVVIEPFTAEYSEFRFDQLHHQSKTEVFNSVKNKVHTGVEQAHATGTSTKAPTASA